MNKDSVYLKYLSYQVIFITLCLLGLPSFCKAEQSAEELEGRLLEIDERLQNCSHLSLRTGVGAIGYRSESHESSKATEWVKVSFDKAHLVDQIVLTPVISRSMGIESSGDYRPEGFPREFHIVVGLNDSEGEIIADFELDNIGEIGMAPLTINFDQRPVMWVKLVATKLSPRSFDNAHVLQLTEILVFSDDRNVALQQKVSASSLHTRDLTGAWAPEFLVDGQLPYLMMNPGDGSTAYLASVARHTAFDIDLGETWPITEIQLHAVEIGSTVPQAHGGGLGVPPDLLVEGASNPNFFRPILLADFSYKKHRRPFNVGPINIHPVANIECRYVRVRTRARSNPNRFGFAEIVIISNGKNVAIDRPVMAKNPLAENMDPIATKLKVLTDGKNRYGEIMSIRPWLNQLALRQQLKNEKELITAKLSSKYLVQKTWLRRMSWLAALLGITVAFSFLVGRVLRLRQSNMMRERFAADLHDEIGANIHSIGLYGDLARDAESKEELIEYLDLCRIYTDLSGEAIRTCAKKIKSGRFFKDIHSEIEQVSKKMMVDLEHELIFEGESQTQMFSQQTKLDIILFYKESLINILRHSEASKVKTKIISTPHDFILTIIDDGIGIQEVPASLKRRARLLRGKVGVEALGENGAHITLKVSASLRDRLHSKFIS